MNTIRFTRAWQEWHIHRVAPISRTSLRSVDLELILVHIVRRTQVPTEVEVSGVSLFQHGIFYLLGIRADGIDLVARRNDSQLAPPRCFCHIQSMI